jgi:positive regulator of sigma E activity
MRHNGVVREERAGRALVEISGGESCSGCSRRHACFGLTGGGVKTRKVWAENRIEARPGDMVEVELKTSSTIGVIAVTFLLPVVMLFAGYLVGAPGGAGSAALGALAGLAAGGLIAVGVNRALCRRSSFRMEILRVLERSVEGERNGGESI